MKRKIWIFFCISAICLFLSGCALSPRPAASGQNGETAPLQVVCTVFPAYDFVRTLTGGAAEVFLLLSPGEESHSFEPTPQDILLIQQCDLFIYVGGESDTWLSEVLANVAADVTTVRLMDLCPTLAEEQVEGMQLDHDHEADEQEGHDHEHEADAHEPGQAEVNALPLAAVAYDEHVWTSPVNAMRIVSALADTLSLLSPSATDTIAANRDAYLAELAALDAAFRETVAQGARQTIIFGDRFPFLYFAKEYGLTYYAAFPGCAGETEPAAATVAFLIDKVEAEAIPVVFCNELSSGNIARAIAEAAEAKVLTFYACHNLSASDLGQGETYLSLMWKNVASLQEALN